jgi:formylglycine-generating enzyme required for sulfatase activity
MSWLARPAAAAASVAVGGVIAFASACGGDEVEMRPGASAPPAAACSDDDDCESGGKCKDVGGKRVCLHHRSCNGKPGADASCGGTPGDETKPGTQDCCAARQVPGGKYNRFNDPRYPATVSPFIMDVFEVTAGRFRAWVEATNGNLRANAPAPGAGAHPKIPNSGWRSEWNNLLPSSLPEVDRMLGPTNGVEGCQVGGNLDDYGALTWWTASLDSTVKRNNARNPRVLEENTKEALDRKPLNCVPWYVLFAFCIWDGGRLPTDAEWGFAAAGGSEQRPFPWADRLEPNQLVRINDDERLSLEPLYSAGARLVTAALYDGGENSLINYKFTWGGKEAGRFDNALHIAPVGRKAAGNGKWGHADLAGGVYEWTLDRGPVKPGTCNDCADVAWPGPASDDPDGTESQIPDFKEIDGKPDKRWYKGGARVVRGGAWDNVLGMSNTQSELEIVEYTNYPVGRTYRSLGGRCVRDF